MGLLRHHFQFNDDAELSIEVDPREIELDVLDHLRQEGFNRLSMGVQDFNKEVQRLVNREQDEEFIFALIQRARELGFTSTNIDLIYGLPKQTPESFAFTLKRVVELNPHRLSVFNYAHLPSLFAAQRKIKETDLPSAQQRLDILQETISSLTGQVISLSVWITLHARMMNWLLLSVKVCCTVISRVTPLRGIATCWEWGFRPSV